MSDQGWQPIASAPKDGTAILAFSQTLSVVVVDYDESIGDSPEFRWTPWRVLWDGDRLASAPTHWMPLPAPPRRSSNG